MLKVEGEFEKQRIAIKKYIEETEKYRVFIKNIRVNAKKYFESIEPEEQIIDLSEAFADVMHSKVHTLNMQFMEYVSLVETFLEILNLLEEYEDEWYYDDKVKFNHGSVETSYVKLWEKVKKHEDEIDKLQEKVEKSEHDEELPGEKDFTLHSTQV